MELALGAATVALARAGASGLAELAAMRVPAVLVPFPAAADNHQFHNALAFVESSAARMVEQHQATPETLAEMIMALLRRQEARQALRSGLTRWDFRDATDRIAELLLRAVPGGLKTGNEPASSCTTPPAGWRVPTAEARADAQ
jgi:UDP-N-acetylglucosamine--N-acetylmuramyl-(pentapeptide) pyrophosphoryl-undecaprenol N-acetylglucosamine transferase